MNEEIKEILDRLDFNEWEIDLYKVPITWAEMYDIRDYITNLQQYYNDNVNKYEDLIIKYSNLQEENDKLKNNLLKGASNLAVEKFISNNATKDLIDYKSRCEKAIEYIEYYAIEDENFSKLYSIEERELLQILKGDK